jgi:hypothetical protein
MRKCSQNASMLRDSTEFTEAAVGPRCRAAGGTHCIRDPWTRSTSSPAMPTARNGRVGFYGRAAPTSESG